VGLVRQGQLLLTHLGLFGEREHHWANRRHGMGLVSATGNEGCVAIKSIRVPGYDGKDTKVKIVCYD